MGHLNFMILNNTDQYALYTKIDSKNKNYIEK